MLFAKGITMPQRKWYALLVAIILLTGLQLPGRAENSHGDGTASAPSEAASGEPAIAVLTHVFELTGPREKLESFDPAAGVPDGARQDRIAELLSSHVETTLVSRPAMLLCDGAEGTITVGEKIPSVRVPVAASEADAPPPVEYKDIGLEIKVRASSSMVNGKPQVALVVNSKETRMRIATDKQIPTILTRVKRSSATLAPGKAMWVLHDVSSTPENDGHYKRTAIRIVPEIAAQSTDPARPGYVAPTRPLSPPAGASTPDTGPQSSRGRNDSSPPSPSTGWSGESAMPIGRVQPTRLELAILQLSCPTDILPRIDVDRLTAGNAEPVAILDRLQQLGPANIAFQVDNRINLNSESRMTQGARVPSVRDVAIGRNGVATPSVTYEKIGSIVKIRGLWREEDPQVADIAAEIETSTLTETPIQVTPGVNLPGFGELSIKQTFSIQNGVPLCLLFTGNPATNGVESISTVSILHLRLSRLDQPAPTAAAFPTQPQTLIRACILEVTGEKEKLEMIDLGKEPPDNEEKLEETLGWFGKVVEVARPSILALWPSRSTVTIGIRTPTDVSAEASPTQDRPRTRIHMDRSQLTLTIDGQWSDDDPQRGHMKLAVDRETTTASKRKSQDKFAGDMPQTEVDIRDNVSRCLMGKVIAGERPEDSSRRYIILVKAKRITDATETPPQPRSKP